MSDDRLEVFRDDAPPVEVESVEPEPTRPERWCEELRAGADILTLPPVRWLVPGWLPADSVAMLYGQPGSGKSFVATSLALEFARGGFWAGSRLEPLSVLYVLGERTSDVRDRVEGWCVHHETTVPGGLYLWPPSHVPQLTSVHDVTDLTQLIEMLGVRLVIIDTFARLTLGAEENSSKDLGPVLEGLERLRKATNGGSVLVVHHSPKDESRGPRGSSAILGAVSVALKTTGTEGRVQVKVTKANSGPEPAPDDFQLLPVSLTPDNGEERSSAVLIHGVAPQVSSHDRELLLELLTEAFAGEASRRQLVRGFDEQHGRRLPDTTVGKALTELGRSGLVEKVGKGPATRWRLTSGGLLEGQ